MWQSNWSLSRGRISCPWCKGRSSQRTTTWHRGPFPLQWKPVPTPGAMAGLFFLSSRNKIKGWIWTGTRKTKSHGWFVCPVHSGPELALVFWTTLTSCQPSNSCWHYSSLLLRASPCEPKEGSSSISWVKIKASLLHKLDETTTCFGAAKRRDSRGNVVTTSLLKTPTETTEDATSILLATRDPKP